MWTRSSRKPIQVAVSDPAMIERGILPVCRTLNSLLEVTTLWSCEGHTDRPSDPYVTFLAPQATAFRIHQLLGHGYGVDDSLKFCWHMTANFRDAGDLQWTIRPNDYRIPGPVFGLFRRWNRRSMDAELVRLAMLLDQAKETCR